MHGKTNIHDCIISDVLELCSEDAEETLYELGFGCEEPQVTVRIPPRFFTFPSQAQGINFRLFLDSQIRRIREEDPSLSLASRFRQVQVLTAMANAFYSLYSHVSRTPLQKLSTPEFTFSSSVQRIERFRSSIRSEPRSPVERLKDTVNKMCLYTGSPRGSDSTSPQPSPRKRSSLPEVVDIVWKNKSGVNKKLDLEEWQFITEFPKY
uniref:Thymocyte expressed, positive selection associated 1 n=2 Tax=Haplochromini TaxID=319058 RepID=A0A3Q2VVU5_HAPBU